MSLPLSRPKPVSQQVNAILRNRIRDNIYPPGSRLPSESFLCEEFGVSRATIRTALTHLAGDGLVIRKQGAGTYVNQRIQGVQTNGGLWEFGELIEKNGFSCVIHPVSIQNRPATITETKELTIRPGESVVELKRLFYANQKPVIYVVNLIPEHLLERPLSEIDGELPIREILQLYCNQNIAYALSEVSACLAEGMVADALHLQPLSSLLKIHICFYDVDNVPIVSGESYFDDTVLKLRLVQAWQ